MQLDTLQRQQHFLVTQKLTLMVNRYVISTIDSDGSPGEVVAFAEQKRMALKEQVSFYTGEDKRQLLFGFKARSVVDLGATYDVVDPSGTPIGSFRKDFGRSLLRSTWHLDQADVGTITGTERNRFVAGLRRLWDFLPFVNSIPFMWPYHFDFAVTGRHTLSVSKKFHLWKDTYVVEVNDDRLDRRLAIAQAVALDALQSR